MPRAYGLEVADCREDFTFAAPDEGGAENIQLEIGR